MGERRPCSFAKPNFQSAQMCPKPTDNINLRRPANQQTVEPTKMADVP